MKNKIGVVTLFTVITLFSTGALAGACDYRPSSLLGGVGTGIVSTVGAAAAAAGTAGHIAGFYTLIHSVTGATMLGSVAGGASAAGTVGIMGGTAGLVGSVAAFIMAPIVIIPAAIVGAGVGIYEGVCYFQDERITDYDEVFAIVTGIAARADPDYFRLESGTDNATIFIRNDKDGHNEYSVADLYIANGVLKNSDWGSDTIIGNIGWTSNF